MIPTRRPCETATVGPFAVTVSYHPGTHHPFEVFITARGKSGTALDDHLYEIGVTASKMMQGE